MPRSSQHVPRIISLIAAVVVAVACGTNYAYSSWAPQFAQRLKLSSTSSNLIGNFGNLGMYIPAILAGIIVDRKGPRWGVALGAVCLGGGYLGIYIAYKMGPGVFNVPAICFFSFLTGTGSCLAFLAALKTAAVNYPNRRGTATGLPLAGFGLSAFLFSTFFNLAFPDDTSKFLLMLTVSTFFLSVGSLIFIRLLPPVASTASIGLRRSSSPEEVQATTEEAVGLLSPKDPQDTTVLDDRAQRSETTSLLSSPGERVISEDNTSTKVGRPAVLDIRGLALIRTPQFWQLFLVFALVSGIGLMNINNIGNDVQALWRHYDPSATSAFIAREQSMHVSILSLASCAGRLLSGAGSDVLVQKFGRNRLWCMVVSASLFTAAQFASLRIANPYYLALVSALTGLAYGTLYGFSPSLLAERFGVSGMSQNWGTYILAPVLSGNLFNIIYGKVYDSHSIVLPDGERACLEGLSCYYTTSLITFFVGLLAVVLGLGCIWLEGRKGKSLAGTNHDRQA